MTWIEASLGLVVIVAMLLLPGAPIAYALGARGATFLGLALGGSISGIAVGSVLASFANIPWAAWVPFAVTIPIAAIGWAIRRFWTRRSFPAVRVGWDRSSWAVLAGLLIAAVLIGGVIMSAIPSPSDPTQTYDGIYHLNAVRWVVETGDASPLSMSLSTPDQGPTFYPLIWHAIASLAVPVVGGSVVAAANVTTVAIAAVVWPVGCMFLVDRLVGAQRVAMVAVGILSAAFVAFPFLLVEFGVLYPNLLGTALVPTALAALVLALGLSAQPQLETPGRWLMFAWILPGLAMAHPNALFTLAVVAAPAVVYGVVRYISSTPRNRWRTWRIVGVVGLTVLIATVVAVVWSRSKPDDTAWAAYQSFAQAFGEILMNSPRGRPAAIAVSILVVIGVLVAAVRPAWRWLVGSFALLSVLYVFATGWASGALRDAITGLWYNDTFRIAALLPIASVPLATIGAVWLIRWLQRGTATFAEARNWQWAVSRPALVSSVVALVALLVVGVATQDRTIRIEAHTIAGSYDPDRTSAVLSADELAIFDEVERIVPEGVTVAGNPWNGSALVYAYTGRPALFPHVGGIYSEERWSIAEDLATGSADVCAAAREFNVGYILDFGDKYVFAGDRRALRYPAFDDLEMLEAEGLVVEVARHGDAALYQLVGC